MSQSHTQSSRFMAWTIFSSRWLQAPLYFGLIIAQGFYVFQFGHEIVHLFHNFKKFDENLVMLTVLGLIDVVMISNLLVMVIIGGYETFVSPLRMDEHPDLPEWLDHVNANTMKIKLAMALIGISSIHLLKTFINAEKMLDTSTGNAVIMWQVIIHVVFLISAVALGYTAKLADSLPRKMDH
jgi:uncharacterized protein (TIGR00645 family)